MAQLGHWLNLPHLPLSNCFYQLTLQISCQNLCFENCETHSKKAAIKSLISQVNKQIVFENRTFKNWNLKMSIFQIILVFGET